MDGSYNNPYAHAQSPLSPDTPTNTFQINVNRKKTQKWVRAKVQNYDGDDWGTDEYEDDDEDDEPEPPPQPVSRVTTGLRPVGPRLPSETRASPRVAAANAAANAAATAAASASASVSSSPNTSGPPPLQLQTQQQQQQQASSYSPAPTGTPIRTALPSMQSSTPTPTPSSSTAPAPGPSRNASPAPVPTRFPPRESSVGPQGAPEAFQPTAQLVSAASSIKSGHSLMGPRTASPAGRSTPDRSSPLVRPAEIYRRMEGEKERDKERSTSASPRPIPDNASAKVGERSASPAERADSSGNAAPRMQSTLDMIAQRKGDYGLHRFPRTSSPDPNLTQPDNHRSETPKWKPIKTDEADEADQAPIENVDHHRLSISPKLPDVARMSLFGPDLFSSTVDFSDAPPVPAIATRKEPPASEPEAPKPKETPTVQPRQEQPPQTAPPQKAPPQKAPISTPSPPPPHSPLPLPLPVASIVNPSPSPSPPVLPTSATPVPAPEGLKSAMDGSSPIYSRDAPSGPSSHAQDSVSPKPLSLASETQSHGGVSPLSDQNDHSARPSPNLIKQKPVLYPGPDPRSIPPLRTPSPNTKGSFAPRDLHSDSPQPSPSVAVSDISSSSPAIQDITPTEPLQPRRPDDSPAVFQPKPVHREPTTSTITSSPVKESDVLTDEIMRSLSPVKTTATLSPPPDKDNRKSVLPGGRSDTRVSTYTLSDYDNYWADTTEKSQPETSKASILPPPVPEPTKEPIKESVTGPIKEPTKEPIKEPPQQTALPVNAAIPTPSPSTEAQNSRRRFSWEAEFDDNVKDLKVENPADAEANAPPKAPIPSIKSPSSLGQSDSHSPTDAVSDITSPSNDEPNGAIPPSIVIPPGGISHQVSKASTAQPGNLQTSMLEPPSPVSVMSEQNLPQGVEKRPGSVLDEMKPKTPTPPPTRLTPTTSKPPAPPAQPVMSLRDIMALPTSSQRVARYEETRVAFSSMDSGLQDWVTAVKSEYPEHANVTSVFNGGAPASRHGHTPSSSVSNPSLQQPYYQQYLNASSPTTSAPASARSRLGKQSTSSQPASAFSNSGDKIGTKSKEFMHSAGKISKGLLSKGKSKLRSHGEKGEPIPPPVQQKVKNERRTSWGLSIGSKSRAEGPAAHSSPDMTAAIIAPAHPHPNTSTSTSTSQYPEPIPVSPLDATFESSTPSRDSLLLEAQGPRYVEDEPDEPSPIDNERDDSIKWEIPTPVSKDSTPWDPFRNTGLAHDDDSDADANSGVKLDAQEQTPKIGEPEVALGPNNLHLAGDQATVPQESNPQVRMVTPEPPADPTADAITQPPQSPPQDTFVASGEGDITPRATTAARQIQMEEEAPKRHSSFIGLPPIRRGSTFGLNSKAARPAAERFSLDDEDEDGKPSHVPQAGKNEKAPAVPYTSPIPEGDGFVQGGIVPSQQAPAPAPAPAPVIMTMDQQVPPKLQQPQWPRPHPPPLGMHPTTSNQLPGQVPGQSLPGQQLPGQQLEGQQLPGQQLAGQQLAGQQLPGRQLPGNFPNQAAGQSSGQFSQNMQFGRLPLIPPGMAGNPVHKLPPSGPWNLQESHLSEPLHPVTRNRAGIGSSQQAPQNEPFYGYDKETGITLPTPVSPAKQQKKTSDMPPSSTRRYPELFSPPPQQQPGYQRPQSNPVLPGQQFQGHLPRDGSFPRLKSSGQDAPSAGEERGRKKTSGLFKDFGSRFRRSSTDRQSSLSESKPGPRPDDASESSMATEEFQDRKKRRSSFLLGRRGRPSLDLGSRSDVTQDSGHEQATTGAPLHPQSERKHSLFGAGLAAQLKMKTSGPPRSSTSSLVNEPGSANNNMPPPSMKKRFSGFGSKAGVFHRPSMDQVQKPGASHSIRSATSIQALQSQNSMGSPSMSPQHMSQGGPIPVGPPATPRQGTPEVDLAEKRKRRGSASGLLSGLLGREASPKPRDQAQVEPPHQLQQPQPQFQHQPQPQPQPQLHPLQSHPHQSQQQPQVKPQGQPQVQPKGQLKGQLQGQLQDQPPGQLQVQPSPITTPSEARQPMLRRMTGSSSLLDSPNQTSPDRTSVGRGLSTPELVRSSADPALGPVTPQKQSSPISMLQPRPSPLGPGTPGMRTEPSNSQILTGSPKPPSSQIFTGSPKPPSSQIFAGSPRPPRASSYSGSPKLAKSSSLAGSPNLGNVRPLPQIDDNQTRVVSSPPDLQIHSTQPPSQQTPGNMSTQSMDFAVQTGVEPRDTQKVGFSPELSRRAEGVALSTRTASVNQDLPQSPVSQMSRTGPPSIASSGRGQSPHLSSVATAMGGKGGRGFSQPTSPALSTAPTVSSLQPQSFGTRMSAVPQQQQPLPPPSTQAVQQRQPAGPPQPNPQMVPPQALPQLALPRVGPQTGHQIPIQGQQGQGFPQQQQQQPVGRPFPGHTPQTSPHPSRSSMQMPTSFPPQGPPRTNATPHGQGFLPMPQPPRQDSPSSKWKGLKSRMSGQVHSSPQSHEKPPGHEKTSSKFLSAFKRSSKQSEPAPSQGFSSPMQQRQGWQQVQHPQQQHQQQQQYQQQQQPTQFMRQPPYAQGQQQQLSPPMTSPPIRQGPYPQAARTPSYNMGQLPPQGQPSPLQGPQAVSPRQPSMDPRQPSMDPRQAPPQSPSRGFQDPLQRQRPAQQFQEQQYDQVPIPKGYAPVHGEGQVVPTAYNLGRGIGQSYQAQHAYMGQPVLQHPQHQANVGMLLPRQAPSPVVLQQQQMPPLGDRGISEGPRLSQAGQGGFTSPLHRGQSFEVNQQPRPDVPRGQSGHGSHTSRVNTSPTPSAVPPPDPASIDTRDRAAPAPQNAILDTRPNRRSLSPPQPPPSVASLGTTSVAPTNVSGEPLSRDVDVVTTPPGPGLEQEEARPGVPNTAPTGHDKASPPNSNKHSSPPPIDNPTSGEDEADKKKNNLGREASPEVQVPKGKTVASPSDDESSDEAKESRRASAVRSPAQKEDMRAELEDTEEAHRRKMRLASQEEKIHYDPNADSDGEVLPQMSATSYPGQEWNPYGMEYGEWE